MAVASSVAIVTGASSGIVEEVARQWIAHGHIAVLVARTEPALKAAAEELGPNAVAWPLDVSDLGALAAMREQVVSRARWTRRSSRTWTRCRT